MSCRVFGIGPAVTALLLSATAILAATGPAPAVAAPECLAAPDDTPTDGRRWFYRLDHGTSRKCWYLKSAGEPRAAAPARAEASAADLPPAPAVPLAAAAGAGSGPTVALSRPSHPLTESERDALYREFLAWRLQQPPE
ncbi:hypothetical protein [Rhodoplanes roseus]|uniref:Secreted protein n=1 Tax=Rhodoplanes roseus TaxID=29409 RepID=A0A327L515_9BRAD|nr:hypothetical protein [Rhodoplanes roseus]RAI45075.1 hypothetical protein CH341_05830 [Rhodoplanes roseus]